MKYKSIIWSITFSILSACGQKDQAVQNENTPDIEVLNSDEDFMEYSNARKIQEINERILPSQKIESLSWEKQTKSHGSEFIQVEGYLNADGFLMKIIENYSDGNYRPQGERIYYLEDNKVIAYKENRSEWVDSLNTIYVEKRTVYDTSGPALTQIRKSSRYDNIEESEWEILPSEEHSLEKVNKILSGEGEFETHFISVVQADQLFLLLGEPKPNTEERYTTAVMVEKSTPFIEDLLQHLDTYKFRPVRIQFKVIGGGNQPEFRVLTDIAWKN